MVKHIGLLNTHMQHRYCDVFKNKVIFIIHRFIKYIEYNPLNNKKGH